MDMWNLAADLGLQVVERRGSHKSGYRAGATRIELKPGLRGRVARSILAHEIAHHVLGHRPTEFGPLRKRQETAANAWAARTLITPDAYADAELVREGHVGTMAFDLHVSDELVLAYQAQLLRTDQHVYVAPRMGFGQWAHRIRIA